MDKNNKNDSQYSVYGEVFDTSIKFDVVCDFRDLQDCLLKNNNNLAACRPQFAKFKEACEQKKLFVSFLPIITCIFLI